MKKIKFLKSVSYTVCILTLVIATIVSCKKENDMLPGLNETLKNNTVSNNSIQKNSAFRTSDNVNSYCQSSNFTLTSILNPDGTTKWSCPKGDGCTRTVPCVRIGGNSGATDFDPIALGEFIKSFGEGRVKEFFLSEKWRRVFPDLNRKPEIVDKLRNGEVVIILRENENTQNKYYIGVESIKINDNIPDALFALEVPS